MKTALVLRDDLLNEALKVTGLKQKTQVIHLGLEELVRKAARKRLIALGGTMKDADAPPRRRARASRKRGRTTRAANGET